MEGVSQSHKDGRVSREGTDGRSGNRPGVASSGVAPELVSGTETQSTSVSTGSGSATSRLSRLSSARRGDSGGLKRAGRPLGVAGDAGTCWAGDQGCGEECLLDQEFEEMSLGSR